MNNLQSTLRSGLASAEQYVDRWKRQLKHRLGLMDPLYILPFRTYATSHSLWLRGRVLENKGIRGAGEDTSVWENLRQTYHRYESDEIPNAKVEVDLGDRQQVLTTNEEGFFDLQLNDLGAIRMESPWTEFSLTLLEPLVDDQEPARARARVLHPSAEARFGVISDMDDTVIRTGATDFFKRLRIELANNAHSREPFAGIAPFYRALHAGGRNPFFYVSSSAWNLFDLFEDFLEVHEIPLGPILLKEMGLTERRWLKSGHDDYKADRVSRILETYPEMRFILIGDSGQRDPFIYEQVVESHPDRVLAVYIRDVSDDAKDEEVREVAARLKRRGVDLLLMPHCGEAARHARKKGWIDEAQVNSVASALEPAAGS